MLYKVINTKTRKTVVTHLTLTEAKNYVREAGIASHVFIPF